MEILIVLFWVMVCVAVVALIRKDKREQHASEPMIRRGNWTGYPGRRE